MEATDIEFQKLKDRVQALEIENELLRQEKSELKIIFDRALDAIVVFDKDANFKDVNEAACEMFELSKEELVTRNIRDFLMLVNEHTIANHIKSLEINGFLSEELIVTLDNGKVKVIEFAARRHVFENGFDLSIMRDVTSKKELEKEWLVNEQMFRDVFNRSPDGIILMDELGKFVDVNPSFCESLVMEKCEILNYTLEKLIDPTYEYKINKLKHLLQKNGRAQGDLPIITKEGIKKIFEFTATANTYNNLYMCILRDNTEKRMMEEELKKSEERFRDIFEYALDAIIIWDDDLNVIRANESSSRTFELSVEELLTHNLMDFIKNNHEAQSIYDELFEKGQIRAEHPFYMPNGEVKYLEFTSKKQVFDGYNMTAFRNVTERKRMEKELRESELKFRKIFDTVMDGIVLLNDNFKIIAVNPVAASILEVCEVSCIGKKLNEIITKDGKLAEDLFNNQMQQRGENIFILHNGTEKILEFACKRQIIPNVHMALFRDVTEKKEMEERLRKSDTLSVVGELAAGIAHEIRNPMTALKGFIQLLQGSVKEDFSMYFDVITTELKRIEMIITEFLILAKPQALSYQRKDITKVMTDTIDLLKPQAILSNVQIISNLCKKLPFLYCEPNQLKQVFINIIKNSIEAMPEGGTIFVSIQQEDEGHIVVSIEDEGCGIPKDKLKKLGEPFYTTKDRGTGLGLMVSYKIIEEHKGTIKVTSKIGVGSVFHITLPSETNMKEV